VAAVASVQITLENIGTHKRKRSGDNVSSLREGKGSGTNRDCVLSLEVTGRTPQRENLVKRLMVKFYSNRSHLPQGYRKKGMLNLLLGGTSNERQSWGNGQIRNAEKKA